MRHIHFAAHGSFAGVGGSRTEAHVCGGVPLRDVSVRKHLFGTFLWGNMCMPHVVGGCKDHL